jgi:uncharacterized protein YyaL (SSP411 family)
VVAISEEGDAHAAEIIPLLKERTSLNGQATAYVCEHYACQRPVTSAVELAAQLEAGSAREASGS